MAREHILWQENTFARVCVRALHVVRVCVCDENKRPKHSPCCVRMYECMRAQGQTRKRSCCLRTCVGGRFLQHQIAVRDLASWHAVAHGSNTSIPASSQLGTGANLDYTL